VPEALADFQGAAALDPRSADLPRECGLTAMLLRRYPEAIGYFDASIALEPHQTVAFVNKAIAQRLSGARLEESRATLERAQGALALSLTETWLEQERLERRHQAAIARIAAMPFDSIAHQFVVEPRALLLAENLRFLGESVAARASFDEARIVLEGELVRHPDDARLHGALAVAYAGLGRKQDAVREARRGLELMQSSKDALVSPYRNLDLARVYTMVDEPDAALQQIESLLSIPCNFSVKLLEIDPWWDPLRKHPRYRELIARFRA
jgi:serine/threonine-protein kinase